MRKAFTLIELLVVIALIIALIGLLAGLLFPVYANVREKGRQTSCASNLRQLTLAMRSYAEDYDGILPRWSFSNPIGAPITEITEITEPAGIGVIDRDKSYFWMTAVHPYVRNAQVFLCPSAPGLRYSEEGEQPYGLNNTGQPYDLAPCIPVAGGPLSGISRPADILLIADSGAFFGMSGAANCTELDHTDNLVARHSDGLNGGFVDGHVKWMKPDTIRANKGKYIKP